MTSARHQQLVDSLKLQLLEADEKVQDSEEETQHALRQLQALREKLVEIDLELLDADLVLSSKVQTAADVLANSSWVPSRSHIAGLRATMLRALSGVRAARQALAQMEPPQ